MNCAKIIRIIRKSAPWVWALACAVLIGSPDIAKAQALLAQGSEQVFPYQPPVANLAFGVPATNFNFVASCTTSNCGPGVNTFLLTTNPTVTIRISITNETANSCLGAFTIFVAASAQASSSFNTQLQQWSSIPLIASTGALASSVSMDLPALSTSYVATTAISARNVAIQIVNTTGGCSTTSIDVSATFTTVSVTSPLVSSTNGIFSSGLTANVQGIVPTGTNGQPIFPVIGGTLGPAANGGTASLGVDTFSGSVFPVASGFTGNFQLGSAPTPTSNINTTFAFWVGFSGASGNGVVAPWTCTNGVNCNSGQNNVAQLSNTSSSSKLFSQVNNSTAQNAVVQFVTFAKTVTVRQNFTNGAQNTIALQGNSLAGSTLVVESFCNNAVCSITGITDTQGLTWRQIVSSTNPSIVSGQSIWIAGPTTAAADTVTLTPGGAAISGNFVMELTGTSAAALNQPSAPLLSDANKNLFVDSPNPIALSNSQSISTPVTSSATGTASAITATIAAVPGKFSYLTGFQVTGAGATGASVITVTVTGTISGTLSYNIVIPAGVTTSITPLIVTFSTPIPSSAVNTAIVVNVPSFGAGNTNSAVTSQGFQQ